LIDKSFLKQLTDESKEVYEGVAELWTTVTHDDLLISHLIDVYYTHQYPMVNTHHKETFLGDFSTGKQEYCSSVLVNIILANAAVRVPMPPGKL